MTPRERVKRAVLFQGPDRVPWSLPEKYGNDFRESGCDPDPGWKPKFQSETKWEDEWGCVWEKPPGDKTMGQVRYNPLDDYSKLADYRFPDYENGKRYETLKRVIGENKEEKFILAAIPMSLIHRLEYLRGHEAGWTDPYLYPERVDKLLDRICDINITVLEHFAELGVDGVISCDDWGLQDRLMVKPEVWHQVWKPKYKKVYGFAKSKGILTFLHSCGYIIDILGGLIEADLNVIQMDQQENMGVDRLSRLYGGRLCFWCPVDIQQTMVRGTAEDVRKYARKLIDSFGRFNGGFIAKWYPSPAGPGHTWDKIDAMSETFVEYGSRFYKAASV